MKRVLIRVALAAFLAFEATRAVVMGGFLLPYWQNTSGQISVILSRPWWSWLPALTITFLAFVIPMALVVFGLWKLHRRLFRNGTPFNSLG